VEWRPSSDVKVVVDGFKTRLNSPQVGYQLSFYPLYAPGRWSNMKISNGVVTDLTLSSTDPEMRLNPELLNKTEYRVVDTAMYGANAEWKLSPTLKLTGDIYESTSKRHSGGQDSYVVLRMNQPNVTRIQLTGAAVPDVKTTFADGRDLQTGLAQGLFKASDFNTHHYSRAGDNIDDKINGVNVDAVWSLDRFYIDSLKFGLSQTNRKKSRDLINNALNGGADHYSGENAINVGALGGNVINQTLSPSGFLDGVSGNFPRSFLGFDVDTYAQALKAWDGKPRPGGGVYSTELGACLEPAESYRVTEKTTTAFVQADLAGDGWNADVGLRFVRTKTTSQAWDAKITSIIENGPGTTPPSTRRRPSCSRRPATTSRCPRSTSPTCSPTTCSCAWARPRPWPGRRSTSWRRPAPPPASPGASSARSSAATPSSSPTAPARPTCRWSGTTPRTRRSTSPSTRRTSRTRSPPST
jgi:hypothetical protein